MAETGSRYFTLLAIGAAAVAFFAIAKRDVPQPDRMEAGDRGFELHLSVRKSIETRLEVQGGYSFSRPGEPDTGYEQLEGVDWRLFGAIQPSNGIAVPWNALVTYRDNEPQHDLKLLNIGGRAVVSNNQILTYEWYPAKALPGSIPLSPGR